jgi:OFA family oxalate/formate antiporter-like MFS transporter
MIVAWSIGGVVGPLLTAALYESSGNSYTLPFTVLAVITLVALVLPLITRMPSAPALEPTAEPTPARQT